MQHKGEMLKDRPLATYAGWRSASCMQHGMTLEVEPASPASRWRSHACAALSAYEMLPVRFSRLMVCQMGVAVTSQPQFLLSIVPPAIHDTSSNKLRNDLHDVTRICAAGEEAQDGPQQYSSAAATKLRAHDRRGQFTKRVWQHLPCSRVLYRSSSSEL